MILYGQGGRTFRCLWMLEEAGIDYERVLVDWSNGETLSAEYLSLNPNGKVPLLMDGESTVFESLLINYYIALNYAPSFWVQDNLAAAQWLAWGLSELEGPHDAANQHRTKIDVQRFNRSTNFLRSRLKGRKYLMEEHFSVIDLNIACLLLRPQYHSLITADADLAEWLCTCRRRPALGRATKLNDTSSEGH